MASEITATTAPTGAISPAGTRISASTPVVVDGTSMDTLSVSISNRLSPGLIGSPADLNHCVIFPSATVSPSCGISTSIDGSPRHRNVLGLHELHQAFVRALAADARLLHAAERSGGIRGETARDAGH